jgi:putative ABC transport system permease protein
MNPVILTPFDLTLAASLVVLSSLLSWRLRLGLERSLLIATFRSALQLSLLGLVLHYLFNEAPLILIFALTFVMLGISGYEVFRRQKYRFKGLWGYGIGSLSMLIASFSITLLALTTIIKLDPWYQPQYLIPLLGMMLGNTMNGVSISLDNLTQITKNRQHEIEARLILGQSADEAIYDIKRDALRSGLIPIINTMSIAGIVSIPGMMTGQILAGNSPMEAAKYQILILFLIAAGTAFGSMIACSLGCKRLFDERMRLRLERLT